MSKHSQSSGRLVWRELLSSKEICQWVVDGKKPERLRQDPSVPGVYRFVFTAIEDENGEHTPFYVGEAGNIHARLCYHFGQGPKVVRRDANGTPVFRPGWRLRGKIRISEGKFTLEYLDIEGFVDLCGVTLNKSSFESPFARRLLENWGLLCSISGASPRHLNVGPTQQARDFINLFKNLRQAKQGPRKPVGEYVDPNEEIEKMRSEQS